MYVVQTGTLASVIPSLVALKLDVVEIGPRRRLSFWGSDCGIAYVLVRITPRRGRTSVLTSFLHSSACVEATNKEWALRQAYRTLGQVVNYVTRRILRTYTDPNKLNIFCSELQSFRKARCGVSERGRQPGGRCSTKVRRSQRGNHARSPSHRGACCRPQDGNEWGSEDRYICLAVLRHRTLISPFLAEVAHRRSRLPPPSRYNIWLRSLVSASSSTAPL